MKIRSPKRTERLRLRQKQSIIEMWNLNGGFEKRSCPETKLRSYRWHSASPAFGNPARSDIDNANAAQPPSALRPSFTRGVPLSFQVRFK